MIVTDKECSVKGCKRESSVSVYYPVIDTKLGNLFGRVSRYMYLCTGHHQRFKNMIDQIVKDN